MKLNGFRASHRNKWILVACRLITQQELSLYEYYVDVADFDPRHNVFGCFEDDLYQTANIFQYSSLTSVRSKRNKLVKIGLIRALRKRDWFQIPYYDRFLLSKHERYKKAHEYHSIEKELNIEIILKNYGVKQEFIDEIDQKIDRFHIDHLMNTSPINIVSSKVESKFVDITSKQY